MSLPDAPYIREAELWGMPEPEPVYCPICGAEDPEPFYFSRGAFPEIIGCDECIRAGSADEAAEYMWRRNWGGGNDRDA